VSYRFRKPLNEVEDVGLGDPLIRTRMLNSFRKLPSPEVSCTNSDTSGSEPELISTKRNNQAATYNVDNKDVIEEFSSGGKESFTSNRSKGKHERRSSESNPEKYENALLFIYSLGGMRLLILLEKEHLNDSELIHSLVSILLLTIFQTPCIQFLTNH
jgi:hypothetical protein